MKLLRSTMNPAAWPARRFRQAVALVAMGLVASGCGPSRDPNLPPTAAAGGNVTYNGKPIDHGAITLHPLGEGNPAVGAIDEKGNFELSTYALGDGAVLGQHKVTVDIPPPLDGMHAGEVLKVPKAYTTPEASPITVEITADGENRLQLVVED